MRKKSDNVLIIEGFLGSLAGRESDCMQETTLQSLSQKDPLEKG